MQIFVACRVNTHTDTHTCTVFKMLLKRTSHWLLSIIFELMLLFSSLYLSHAKDHLIYCFQWCLHMQRMPCLSLAVCLCENWKSTRNVPSAGKPKRREATTTMTTKHHSMKSTERTNNVVFIIIWWYARSAKKRTDRTSESEKRREQMERSVDAQDTNISTLEWNHILKYSKRIFTVLLLHIEPSVSHIHTFSFCDAKNEKSHCDERRWKNLLPTAQWMIMRKYVDGARKVWIYFHRIKNHFVFLLPVALSSFLVENRKK